MIDRDQAVRMVEEELERSHRRELSVGLDPMRMAVSHAERHEPAWIVSWTTEEYLRTGNPHFMLGGNGPYLVDSIDGSLHQIGVASAMTDAREAHYRARIRGETTRTAVDDLHDEVRAAANTRGRVHAMLFLRRRLPVLTHDQIVEYVIALHEGDAPAHLVDIATGALVPPTDPLSSVITLRGAEHRRAP